MLINTAGINVSNGNRIIAVLRHFGEAVAVPFKVLYIASELKIFATFLKYFFTVLTAVFLIALAVNAVSFIAKSI